MGVSLGKVALPISGFFEASRLTVAELGQRLVDLGGSRVGVVTMILGVSQLCTRWLF